VAAKVPPGKKLQGLKSKHHLPRDTPPPCSAGIHAQQLQGLRGMPCGSKSPSTGSSGTVNKTAGNACSALAQKGLKSKACAANLETPLYTRARRPPTAERRDRKSSTRT